MTEQAHPCVSCGVTRREFVERSTLAALSTLLLSSCGDGEIGGVTGVPGGGTRPPLPGGALLVNLADFPELGAVGGTARVDTGTAMPIGVSRTGASSFVAVSMICPHAGFRPIDIRPVGYRCPNHGAVFADDGTWTGGQPTTDLARYVVAYDAVANTLSIT